MIRIFLLLLLLLLAAPLTAHACRLDMNAASVCPLPWYDSMSNRRLNAQADVCNDHAYRKFYDPATRRVRWRWDRGYEGCERVWRAWWKLVERSWR